MQFSTAFIALASAMAATATPIFTVNDFSASCIPHSSQCSYDFKVLQSNSMETTGVDCNKLLTSDGLGSLPAVTDGTCTNSSRTWTVTKSSDGGLVLAVTQQVTPASNETGSYTIPSSDIVTSTTGASSQQSYTGPTTFDLA